jgi:hypothetical protein
MKYKMNGVSCFVFEFSTRYIQALNAPIYGFLLLITWAGFPATMLKGGTSLVTTAPAATMEPFPTVTPANRIELAAIQQSSSILTKERETPCSIMGLSESPKLWFSE